MNSRELFYDAASLKKTPRAPFWIMRQAGRYLPEYRALKEKHSFLEIVQTPELALEASLQPIRRFDFDCAIIFSDILVVSEALGFKYKFKDGGGIVLEKTVRCKSDIENIAPAEAVRARLQYVAKALKLLRDALPQKALLGFCGSPFTLGAYMFEGSSSTGFEDYKKFAFYNPELFEMFIQKLKDAIVEYAKMQAECGIDGFQIFDTHAALTPMCRYNQYSAKYSSAITKALKDADVKTILYARGMDFRFEELLDAQADIYSVDSKRNLSELADICGKKYALQGNLDENLLSCASPKEVEKSTLEILKSAPLGHILNLGHGIKPDAKLENVQSFVNTAKNYKYNE